MKTALNFNVKSKVNSGGLPKTSSLLQRRKINIASLTVSSLAEKKTTNPDQALKSGVYDIQSSEFETVAS